VVGAAGEPSETTVAIMAIVAIVAVETTCRRMVTGNPSRDESGAIALRPD
jgi:hypothetical protein